MRLIPKDEGFFELFDQFETFGEFFSERYRFGLLQIFAKSFRELVEIGFFKHLANDLATHAYLKGVPELDEYLLVAVFG